MSKGLLYWMLFLHFLNLDDEASWIIFAKPLLSGEIRTSNIKEPDAPPRPNLKV